ncbi:MAG: drug/metabolite transporter [Spirochaetota bacterium]
MNPIAILIVLASATVHAGWNLLGKRARPAPAYFAIASLAGAVLLSPLLILWGETLPLIPGSVWLSLLVTGAFQATYMTGLAAAYRTGDLSLAYPVARALPVLLVPLVTGVLGIGESVSPLGGAGMITVVIGLLLVVHRSFATVRLASFLSPAVGWALLAGIGTTGYSIIDNSALELFRAGLAADPGDLRAPLVYIVFESVSTAIWLVAMTLVARGPQRVRADFLTLDKRLTMLAGIGIVVAYGLVLVAFGFAENVSYVVAFRQVSLPIRTLFGVVVLRERVGVPRLMGTLLIVTGLVLVATG